VQVKRTECSYRSTAHHDLLEARAMRTALGREKREQYIVDRRKCACQRIRGPLAARRAHCPVLLVLLVLYVTVAAF